MVAFARILLTDGDLREDVRGHGRKHLEGGQHNAARI